MLSGVSPCAICQTISPLLRSIAVMRPYGGFTKGRPWMFRAGPPPSPPPPPTVELGGGAFGFGAVPRMKFMSDNCGLLTSPISVIPVFEKMYMMPVSGSYDPHCQLAPPVVD